MEAHPRARSSLINKSRHYLPMTIMTNPLSVRIIIRRIRKWFFPLFFPFKQSWGAQWVVRRTWSRGSIAWLSVRIENGQRECSSDIQEALKNLKGLLSSAFAADIQNENLTEPLSIVAFHDWHVFFSVFKCWWKSFWVLVMQKTFSVSAFEGVTMSVPVSPTCR